MACVRLFLELHNCNYESEKTMTNALRKLSDHIFNILKVCNFINSLVLLFLEREGGNGCYESDEW